PTFTLLSRVPPQPHPPHLPYTTLFRSRTPSLAQEATRATAAITPAHLRNLLNDCTLISAPISHQAFFFSASANNGKSPDLFKPRSEEHTSQLQSLRHLVCRLLLEKKKH